MADKSRLLVEGKDDEHVLYQLLMHHNVPQTFHIRNKQGIENLLETLDVELVAGGLERLGIIVDADTAPAVRWQDLRSILLKSGYTAVPDVPETAGTIIEQRGRPRVGVWIMPDNAAAGMLEDFVGLLVPPGDALWPFAEDCVRQVITRDRRFPLVHQSKALIHTWLSWQKEPGTPLGLAIRNRELDANALATLPLIHWLRQMFD